MFILAFHKEKQSHTLSTLIFLFSWTRIPRAPWASLPLDMPLNSSFPGGMVEGRVLAAGAVSAQEPLYAVGSSHTMGGAQVCIPSFFPCHIFFFSFETVLGSQAGLKLTRHS